MAGADTTLLHVAKDDARVVPGTVVVPEYSGERSERQGAITDIAYFRLEED